MPSLNCSVLTSTTLATVPVATVDLPQSSATSWARIQTYFFSFLTVISIRYMPWRASYTMKRLPSALSVTHLSFAYTEAVGEVTLTISPKAVAASAHVKIAAMMLVKRAIAFSSLSADGAHRPLLIS